jgi:predicted nucleic acid-binding protein
MPFIFDTNVAIQAIRSQKEKDRFIGFIRSRRGQVWLHAAVWLELQVGARRADEREALDRFVEPFVETQRVLVPSQPAWHHAGRVLARLADEHGLDVRRSSIHYDSLIAASSREREFTIVTNNVTDFQLIAPYLGNLRFVRPFP